MPQNAPLLPPEATLKLRLPEDLKIKIKNISFEQRRSVNAQLITWVEQAINHYEEHNKVKSK